MIDLHTHSSASDGTFSPSELVNFAASKKIETLALTDHDTTDGLVEAQAAAFEKGINFIPGIELNIQWPTGEFHLLGLGLKRVSSELKDMIAFLGREREFRNRKMAQKLKENGINISYEELAARFGEKTLGRPHFAEYMKEKGFVKCRQQAFDNYFAKGRPCFVDREGADLEMAVDAILSSGGLPVQAHPLSMYVSWGRMEETLRSVRERGVLGIEAWHPGARVSEAERLRDMAEKLGFFVTGGSDFHGEKVRADRHIGFSSGGLKISDDCWTKNLEPRLVELHGGNDHSFCNQ